MLDVIYEFVRVFGYLIVSVYKIYNKKEHSLFNFRTVKCIAVHYTGCLVEYSIHCRNKSEESRFKGRACD